MAQYTQIFKFQNPPPYLYWAQAVEGKKTRSIFNAYSHTGPMKAFRDTGTLIKILNIA